MITDEIETVNRRHIYLQSFLLNHRFFVLQGASHSICSKNAVELQKGRFRA